MSRENSGKSSSLDASSFSHGELYAEHFEAIFAFVAGRLEDREIALDLTQEVFYQFMKTNPSPSSIRGKAVSYLFGIARNVVAKHLRGHSELSVESAQDLKPMPRQFREPPVRSGRLQACISRLTKDDRRILFGHFYLGQTHKEIAAELGMTHGQVRQRFSRALQQLRKCLGRDRM